MFENLFATTAALLEEGIDIVWVGVAIGVVVFLMLVVFVKRYMKVGPNEAMIVTGAFTRSIPRVVHGGGKFVWPGLQKAEILSLEVITIDVRTPEVYTEKGVPIIVDGIAQIKVHATDQSIRTAAEQFLGRGRNEIMNVAKQTLEGHLRAILGQMEVEDIYKNRDMFAQKVQETSATDFAKMGLEIVSFTLRDIKDNEGYLDALGKPRLAQVKRDAVVAQAEADRDAVIKSAQAKQAGETERYKQETQIAEAHRDYNVKLAEYQVTVNERKAEADLAYDLSKFKKAQHVKKEEVQVEVVEKQQQIVVQESEIARKQKELDATVNKPADARRYAVQVQADAERYKIEAEASGRAEAQKVQGFAEAEVIKATGNAEAASTKARGLARAEVIQAQGLAEAQAMAKKAESWKQYNEAAITQMFIEVLPELAKSIAEPLNKMDKIVVVNTGGESAGMSKITGDVANIISQLPPVVEALSGVNLGEMVKRIPGIGDSKSKK
ncbi:MAG: flotillin family protein [Deltaproteobacteria bacterium]|nr:flotillin family protein [Deltaproteobacteria bacterium]